MDWRRFVSRWGPWSGILVPGLDALVNGVVAAVQRHYNPVGDYISDLSAPDVPYSGLIRGWWIAFPLFFAPFAFSLYFHLAKGRARSALLSLLLIFALGLCSCGIFHCDPGCQGRTKSAKIHFMSSYAASAALYLSPLALAVAGWNDERWRCYRFVNIGCLVMGAAAGIILFLAGIFIVPDKGLCERLYFGVFYIWVVLASLRLLKMEGMMGRQLPHLLEGRRNLDNSRRDAGP